MINVVKKYVIFFALCCFLFASSNAHAVVQSLRQAKSYQIFALDDAPKKESSSYFDNVQDLSSKVSEDTQEQEDDEYVAINYNRIIAQQLLSKANSNVVVSEHSKRRKINVPLGKDLTIRVIEEDNQTCSYECNDQILTYNSGSKVDNKLSIVFNAGNIGRTKLYVDCITNVPGEGIKVKSKVFYVVVD